MKMLKVLVLICFILNLAAPALADTKTVLNTEAIDSYIEKEMQISSIPGLSLGIIQNGEIIYLQGYGKAGTNLQVSANTPMVIGSLSKSVTAVAVMQLVEDGKIELDSPLQSYLPWFTMQGEYDPADVNSMIELPARNIALGVAGVCRDKRLRTAPACPESYTWQQFSCF